jgi:hypothetical protein
LILFVVFYQTAWQASLTKSATYDEPLHFVSAFLHWQAGDFRSDADNPPLWKYYAVIGTPAADFKIIHIQPLWGDMLNDRDSQNVYCFNEMYRVPANDVDKLLNNARFRMIFLGALLGAVIAFWAWRLRGPIAAVVAAAAFCLDPNFLAHSAIVKNDVPITLLFTALMLMVWLIGERATFLRILTFALLLGAMIATKYSGLLAIPIAGFVFLIRSLIKSPWPILKWNAHTRWQRVLASVAIMTLSCVVVYPMIWSLYDFRFNPASDSPAVSSLKEELDLCAGSQSFQSHQTITDVSKEEWDQWMAQWKPDFTIRCVLFANDHHLLPQAFLRGFLATYGSTTARRNFLLGNLSLLGWWYYFPCAMAFKTPLATLVGLALALVAAVAWLMGSGRSFLSRHGWPICALVIPPAIYMAYSMRSDIDIGLRHIFPVYPFLFIFLGVAASEAWRRHRQITEGILVLLLVGLAVETYHAYPDFIPFFNVAAGGSRGGLQLLSDSNIDWGQELPALAQWQQSHPGRQLYLSYFGSADPKHYKISYIRARGGTSPPGQTTPSNLPGVLAISAVNIQGEYLSPDLRAQYSQLANKEPIAILGGSLYLFDLQ